MIRTFLHRCRATLADPETRRALRDSALLALLACALYLPGINWGLPAATAPGTTQAWGPDEIGPIGPIVELRNNLGGDNLGNPQYPMFHYLWIFLFYLPYLVFQYLTGGMPHPHGGYPFGFTDPAPSVQMLMRISRIVSVLMGAGMAVTAYLTGRALWSRITGFLTGLFVLLMYPMFYFARTSNLDVPVTFWQTLVLLLFALCLKDGRIGARFFAIGIIAAISVATKEQSYGILILLVFPLLAWHFREARHKGPGHALARWKAPLGALAVSAVLYVFLSGLAIRPQKFFRHLDFVRNGSPSGRFYQEYPLTPAGLLGMARECLDHLVEMMGWPFLLAALAGVALCALRREQRRSLLLLLPIPGLFFTVLALAGYVELRYLLPWGWLLSLYAAWFVALMLRSRPGMLRLVTVLLVAAGCGWALLRGLELQYLSLNDSRYVAANWIAAFARPGDRLGYPGPERRIVLMPRFGDTVTTVPVQPPSAPINGSAPVFDTEFVFLIGKDDLVDFWWTPRWAYEGLHSGSLGYELVAEFYTPSRFSPQESHDAMQIGVNPHIQIFARRDRAAELRAKSHR